MIMITRKSFRLPIYGVPYEIAFADSWEEAVKIDPDFPCFQSARTVWDDDTNLGLKMIFLGDSAGPSVCAHECVHLANRIWVVVGYKPDIENDEPDAYLVGHLMSAVMEVRDEFLADCGRRVKQNERKEGI